MSQRSAIDRQPCGSWNVDIAARKDDEVHWIWDGFIPWPGITLLTGASKLGKSTLVSMLLDRRRQGGELLGQRVRPGTTVVVSEEDDSFWARRQQRLDFGPNVFFSRPELPTFRRWRHFIDQLMNLYLKRPFELLVIDSLASFLPAAENDARSLRRALEEFRFSDMLAAGVLLVHHPRRAGGRPGSAARGSAALPALADVLLDLRLPANDPFTRRRRLYGLGRYPQTPQHLFIEMNAEATDYAVLSDADEDAALFAPALDALRDVLAHAGAPLSRQQILECWPNPVTKPTANTLWRWLARGCQLGVLARHGDGSKADAFRYALAEPAAAPDLPAPASRPSEPALVQNPAPEFAAAAPAISQTAPSLAPPSVTAPAPALAQDASPSPQAAATAPASPALPRAEDTTVARPPQPAPAAAQDGSQPTPEPAPSPPSRPLPRLPAHARWLHYLFEPTPEERDKAG